MIKRIFYFLFYSCRHDFKIIDVREVIYLSGLETGRKYTLQCKKCGKVKRSLV